MIRTCMKSFLTKKLFVQNRFKLTICRTLHYCYLLIYHTIAGLLTTQVGCHFLRTKSGQLEGKFPETKLSIHFLTIRQPHNMYNFRTNGVATTTHTRYQKTYRQRLMALLDPVCRNTRQNFKL